MKEIQLTKGKVAIVDDDDYKELSKFSWYASSGYAARTVANPKQCILMHRQILKVIGKSLVDHRDHDGFNNRRSNLRICTHAQNLSNRKKSAITKDSKYKGVRRMRNRWQCRIKHHGITICLGVFSTELEAAKAYNEAAYRYFGEFSFFNNVKETPSIVSNSNQEEDLPF